MLTALAGGTLLGIWQASSKKKAVKNGILFGTMLGSGIPNFVIALLLDLLFGVKWKWFPIAGLSGWTSYILPVLSLAVYPMSVVTRIMQNTFQGEMRWKPPSRRWNAVGGLAELCFREGACPQLPDAARP